MQVIYRPIGNDWKGERTSDYDRRFSPFRAPWSATLKLLDRELRHLDAETVIFQVDVSEGDLRIDGMLRANARAANPAVILSFDSKVGPLRYQCDVFMGKSGEPSWQANVRAIAMGLEALRQVERYGITKRGEQYQGWTALPPPSGHGEVGIKHRFSSRSEAAMHIIKVGAGNDEVGQAALDRMVAIALVDKPYRDDLFRRAAKVAHPDSGGSDSSWASLVEARRIVEG